MRVLGLDIGSRRTGVAVSDPDGTIASPLSVLDTERLLADRRVVDRLVADYEIERIVIGLPLTMEGAEGPQARDVRETAARIIGHLSLPVTYHDERLSSAEASRLMRDAGTDARQQRGSLDKIAAALMLQSWLDAQRDQTREDGSVDG